MSKTNPVDFWYAVNNTRIIVMPPRRLETFGATILNYHMISELMDTAGQVRIREGRIHAYRPQIITPSSLPSEVLEGFGPEAERYAQWLQDHPQELRILQYGFKIRKEEINQHIVTDALNAVMERVEKAVRTKDDPLAAVVLGVDEPWEVCLLKLMVDVSGNSFSGNIRELERRRMFDLSDGVPRAVREEIEEDFQKAARNSSLVKPLGNKLQKYGLFKEYEDRFFALVNGQRS